MSTLVTERRFAAMGTRVHVIVVGGSNDLAFRVGERIDELEQRWSRFRADSELCALNAAAGSEVEVSHDTWVLVSKACQAWRLSRGAFDPTVAASRLRPFARRRFRTARPALVFIRSRKPCLRLRRSRLG